jgi:hypothetical protein
MTKSLFALSFGFAVVIAATQAGHAAPQCAERTSVLAQLAGKFGETRRAIGLSASNTVMEMHASDASGSWTITVTLPNGMTCLVASGQGYEAVVEELPANGAPA